MSEMERIPNPEQPHGGENLEVMADAVNYNEFLRMLVRQYAEGASSVVDFGAGLGTFSGCLGLPADKVHCVESEARSRTVIEQQGFHAYADTSQLPPAAVPYIFTLNVLEHIDDDAASLQELFRIIETGCRLFIYVPAFASLFT